MYLRFGGKNLCGEYFTVKFNGYNNELFKYPYAFDEGHIKLYND